MNGNDILKLVASIIACEGAGFTGSIFTVKSITAYE